MVHSKHYIGNGSFYSLLQYYKNSPVFSNIFMYFKKTLISDPSEAVKNDIEL